MKTTTIVRITLFTIIVIMMLQFSDASASGFVYQNSSNLSDYVDLESLYFTGSNSQPSTLYQDAILDNPDVGLKICGNNPRYVGGFYALKRNSEWMYSLVTYASSQQALAYTTEHLGDGCYATVPGMVTVSPSRLATPSPEVYKAALPGNLFLGFSNEKNPSNVTDFISSDNLGLSGDYRIPCTFDQSSSTILLQVPQIQFITPSGSFSKPADDSTFGVSEEKPLLLGLCTDDDGIDCSDGRSIVDSESFPFSLQTGLDPGQLSDDVIFQRNVVANGISQPVCIGANLRPEIGHFEPDPVYYGDQLDIDYSITNRRDGPYEIDGGNINITSPFTVNIRIKDEDDSTIIYSNSTTVTSGLGVDERSSFEISWPAIAESGNYTIEVRADTGSEITECDESDNQVTETFELKPVALPEIRIDGEKTTEFPFPNVPYNLSIHMKDSDGNLFRNIPLAIQEMNGLSLAAPIQTFNQTIDENGSSRKSGIRSVSKALFRTDYHGNVTFTFVPTYNDLYSDKYDIDLTGHVGDPSIYLTGSDRDGDPLMFFVNGSLTSKYPLHVNSTETNASRKSISHESMISQTYDYIYRTYTNIIRTIVGG
ncbi:MAG: CARDB domain-containing protein [Nanoarchaeota archaeon]